MEPMKPMQPMKPMHAEAWWPQSLGQPSTSGAQNGLRYAVFPDKQRLLVERDGTLETYDSGEHRISGVSQHLGGGSTLRFSSQQGDVALDDLRKA